MHVCSDGYCYPTSMRTYLYLYKYIHRQAVVPLLLDVFLQIYIRKNEIDRANVRLSI
jgi:hypothetical protein